jgi:hypothetical protein
MRFCGLIAPSGVLAALVFTSAAVCAQNTPQAAPPPVAAPGNVAANPAANTAAGGANALTQAAVQVGALSCASRVEQVSRFLGFGPGVGASLMAPAAPADQRLFAMQMEVAAGASSNSLVNMTFAPQQANGCGATYEAISYWAQSCDAVANAQFAQLKRIKPLQKDVLLLDGGPSTRVFLMQAGAGCVSVKKEIVL